MGGNGHLCIFRVPTSKGSREATERVFVGALISKLFDGSATRLVMQALGNDPRANESELAEIRQLLQTIESERA